jgi:hypothetical protein
MELTAPNGLSPIPREQRVVIFVLAFFAGWTRLKYSNVQYLEIFMLLHLSYLMLQLGLRGFTTHLQGLWKTPGRAYGLVMFAILLMSISSIRLPLYPPIYGPYFLHVPLLVVGLRYIELFVVAFYCLYAAELMRRDHRLRDFGLKWYVKSAVITAWMTFAALVIFKITGFAPSSVTDAARGQGMFPEGGPWGLYLVTVAMVTRILWKRKTISHKQMIFVAGTLMYAFYLSRSKSAALATLLIFITQVFFGHNLKQKLTSIVAIGAVCAAAMWIFDVPMLFRMYVELQQKAEVIVWLNRADPNTAYGRVAASVIVPRMIAKHPITGIGVGNYSVMRNDPDYLGIMWPNRDYDLPGLGLLAVAAELGIPCLIGLYGMMLYPAFRVRFAHGNAALLTLALCQPYVHLMGAQITIFYPWMASAFVLSFLPLPSPGRGKRLVLAGPHTVPARPRKPGGLVPVTGRLASSDAHFLTRTTV